MESYKKLLEENAEAIDLMFELFAMIQRNNKLIKSEDDKTDILLLIGQHRHWFADQGVADHMNCKSFTGVTGTFEGVTGLMFYWVHRDALARKCVCEVKDFMVSKKLI